MPNIVANRQAEIRRSSIIATNGTFWDKVADKYASSPVKNMEAYELTLERTKSYLTKEQKVLEVGCGTGTTALLLAPSVKQLTATDISKRMIEICEEKASTRDVGNVQFRQASLPAATLEASFYDTIICFNTLHLMADLPGVLGSLHAALKPGGVFISKTVCLAEQTRLWGVPIFLMRLIGKAPYVNLLKFKDIERAIETENFEIIETGVFPKPFSRFVVARKG